MIDYDKLKLAHELCQKLRDRYFADFIMSGYHCEYTISDSEGCIEDNPFFITESLDDFIIKLQEITKPQPKYKIGDEVWFLNEGNIMSIHITKIDGNKYSGSQFKYYYDCFLKEDRLYPSKQALIQSQIDYWTSLKKEEVSTYSEDMSMSPPFEGEIKGFECEHISDGVVYNGILGESFKCKKCGEFYR